MSENEALISESMEMYLVTIARLRKDDQPVPLSQLAESLSVTAVSVNEMCRKLQDSGYLVYRPYKGAVLTDIGEKTANHILRRHRLWEVFLVEKLHFDYKDAHKAACELEHTTTDAVIDRLDEFLGYPKTNPEGQVIPSSDGKKHQQTTIPILKMPVGTQGHINHCDASGQTKEFMENQGLHPGVLVKVIASGSDSILIEINHKHVSLSSGIAKNIYTVISSIEEMLDSNDHTFEKEMNEVKPKMNSETTATVEQFQLSDLKKGQKGIIVHVGGKGAVKRRMMDMGVVPGSEISVIRVAPFGDPIEFSIKGYSLSLRKSEAKEILVERVN
jgi:DtxR family Mn-dependent transcriptional regulator